ncbi:MAG: caspase family protein [Pseudomonadota bacterium]
MLLLMLAGAGAWPTATLAERVALVIGNGAYEHASALPNPTNDAADVAQALEQVGFSVTVVLDATHSSMRRALRAFQRKATGADVAMVYFAGHGLEIDSSNFLLPVDAELQRDVDVAFEAISLDALLVAVEGARELSLVVLDACRENPFAAQMSQTSATRSIGRGLAVVEPTKNTLLAYAARAGTIAFDGSDRNSPYARALISTLQTPGLEIGLLFRTVRDKVIRETRGLQEPFLYGSLSADPIYLNPASLTLAAEAAPVAPAPAPAPQTALPQTTRTAPAPSAPSSEVEALFWTSIANSTNAADFQAYLETFPNGVFAILARNRLNALAPASTPATAPATAGAAPPAATGTAGSTPATGFADLGALANGLESPSAAPNAVPGAGLAQTGAQAGTGAGQAAPSQPTFPLLTGPAGTVPPSGAGQAGVAQGNVAPGANAQIAGLAAPVATSPVQNFQANDPALDLPLDRDGTFELQERLSAMGYDAGRPDGVYGPRTERAIRAFESDQGLIAIGAATQRVLVRARATLSDAQLAAWRAAQSAPQRATTTTRRQPTSSTTSRRSTTTRRTTAPTTEKPNLCYTAANRACYRMPRPLQHCTKVFSLCGAR